MKKLVLLLSFLLCAPFFAQKVNFDIEDQFRDYNKLIVEKKFSEAIELYGNEDYLKLFPKEELVALMNKMFNDPQITLNLIAPSNVFVSDEVVNQKGKRFVKLNFQQKLEMKFNEEGLNENIILSVLKSSFGDDHVKFDSKTGFFLIDSAKLAVASSLDLKNWKFTVLEKKQIPVLKAFIPEQFLKQIK